jgi:hypothetical protein
MTSELFRQGFLKRFVRTATPFLKWLYVLVLGGGIVGGIVRHFPWKIPLCLAILLIIAIFVPRYTRKWVYGCVGLIVLSLVVWIFLPESDTGWRPFVFEDEYKTLNQKYAVPDNENAAPFYDLVRKSQSGDNPNRDDDLDWLAQSKKVFSTDPNNATVNNLWTQSDFPEIASWLEQQNSFINELSDAANKPSCFWPINPQNLDDIDSSRTRYWKAWILLFVRMGNLEAGSNNGTQAIRKYAELFRLAHHCRQQLNLLEWMVGLASESYAFKAFQRVAIESNISSEDMDYIENQVRSIVYDWSSDWARLAAAEEIYCRSNLAAMFFEMDDHGKYRHTRRPNIVDEEDASANKGPWNLSFWERRWVKTRAIAAWFVLPTHPKEIADFSLPYYSELHSMAKPDYDWQEKETQFEIFPTQSEFRKMPFNLGGLLSYMPNIMMPANFKLHDIFCAKMGDRKATLLTISLRRHKILNGNWPESLSELQGKISPDLLIDPSNGGEFVYRREGDSFRFYSKGKNGIDDGGLRDKKTKTDDYLYWPIEPSPDSGSKTEKPLHPDANPS